MRFTLKQLRYFDAALQTGSIAAAAEKMNISQSSITAALDQIEGSIGVELFRRIPAKGLVATEVGKSAGERIAQFLETARIFESDLMSMQGVPTGSLNMACYAPTAPYVLPLFLKRVAQEYPDIKVDLKEGDMQSITEQLKAGTVDVGLTYRRNTPENMPFLPLFKAPPYALLPEGSVLASKGRVTLQELAELPMIVLDLPTTETYFRGLFKAHGVEPKIVHRTKSSSVLRGLVAAGFGFSILNIYGHGDRDGRGGYIARPIAGELDQPWFGVAYSDGKQRSAIVRAVLEIGAELAANHAFDGLVLKPL